MEVQNEDGGASVLCDCLKTKSLGSWCCGSCFLYHWTSDFPEESSLDGRRGDFILAIPLATKIAIAVLKFPDKQRVNFHEMTI